MDIPLAVNFRYVVNFKFLTLEHIHMNTEDLISIPGTGRYIVVWMTTLNDCPLSLGSIPCGRLKNPKVVGKWSSMRRCLLVRGEYFTFALWFRQPGRPGYTFGTIRICEIIITL